MTDDWSPSTQQQQALDLVAEYCFTQSNARPLFFYLAGYAGSGKTSLAKYFAATTPGTAVKFAAYTGKAALVLRNKGCNNATTIDRLIYKHPSFWTCIGNHCTNANKCVTEKTLCRHAHKIYLPKRLNSDALDGVNMVIIDEVSMVANEQAEDLLSFNVPILVLGDPGQLPPVAGAGYFINGEPNFMLTEIHRQALNNPIIRLATNVREGRLLQFGTYGDSHVIEPKDISVDNLQQYDQILVGRNETRVKLNKAYRKLLGHGEEDPPQVGERLICLRNDSQHNIMNGQMFTVLDTYESKQTGFLGLTVQAIDEIDAKPKPIDINARADIFNNPKPEDITGTGQEFDYGYVITVHKAQGSEYDNVLVIDESYVFPEYQRRKHLYTGITRAAKTVTVARRKRIK